MKTNRFKEILISLLVFAFCLFGVVLSTAAAPGDIMTVAGGGVGDGGLATQAALNDPTGIFVDTLGNLFIADSGNHRIRRVEGIAAPTTLGRVFLRLQIPHSDSSDNLIAQKWREGHRPGGRRLRALPTRDCCPRKPPERDYP